MKKFILALSILTLLSGCKVGEYQKVDGQVVDKYIFHGRFGDVCEMKIAYKTQDGHYVVKTLEVNSETYGMYQPNQHVVVYGNDGGIGGISKGDN